MQRKRIWLSAVLLILICFLIGLIWHQELTKIFVSHQIEVNREEAAETAGRLISHRGACTLAPENSLPAFRQAGELGYWGVECDVSVTKDGNFVLMHDSTVNRTTNGRGFVSHFTLEEIRKLRIDVGANVRYYMDLQVPTLEEFLQICEGYDMTPVIELKVLLEDADYDTLVSILQRAGMEDNALVISFDYEKLKRLREKSPVHTMLLSKSPSKDTVDLALTLENCDLGMDYRSCNRSLVSYAQENGILLNMYTVNDELIRRDLTRWGIHFITTDLLKPE